MPLAVPTSEKVEVGEPDDDDIMTEEMEQAILDDELATYHSKFAKPGVIVDTKEKFDALGDFD